MQLRCPDGSERRLFFQGNNRTRHKQLREFQKIMVDEGVATYEESSLPARVFVGEGTTEAEYGATLDKAQGKGNGKGKGKGKGNEDATASATDPTRAAQIAELQTAINTSNKNR